MRGSHGTFYWNERMTRDVEGAKKFYADTMGWSYDGMPMPGAAPTGLPRWATSPLAASSTSAVPTTTVSPKAGCPTSRSTTSTRACQKAVKAGAKVMKPVFDVPGVGRIAILLRAGGAGVGWMTPAAKRPVADPELSAAEPDDGTARKSYPTTNGSPPARRISPRKRRSPARAMR